MEAPWTVFLKHKLKIPSLGYSRATISQCTGVLITFKWVLTAAHCYSPLLYTKVCVGSGNQDGIEEILEDKWFKHPNYKSDDSIESDLSDIALIRLKKPFTKHSTDGTHYTINTICLPDNNSVNKGWNEKTTFFGFGITNDKQFSSSSYSLRKGEITLLPQHKCLMRRLCGVHPLGTRWARPCQGDSGGGLVQYYDEEKVKAILVGILSSGTTGECSDKRIDTFYISVSLKVDWILQTIRDNS